MRDRVEDLGRIAVLLDNLLEMPIWGTREKYSGRRKDFWEYFQSLSLDDQHDLLHGLIYGLDDLKDGIYQISEIAYGEDRYNESAQ